LGPLKTLLQRVDQAVVRFLRLLPLLGLLAALAVPAAAPAAEVGLNINGGLASGTPQNFDQLTQTGAKWARHFVYYDDAALPALDNIVAQEDARGVKTLFVVAGASRQAPSDPQKYADFVGGMASRFKGHLEAIEIWNEQDEGHFWSGGPNPVKYVDLLQRSYTAIKAGDPHVKVVFGPTVGHNYGFLEQAYAAGAKGYFDVMAAHTDTACLVDSPTKYYRDGNRIGRYVFLGYRELRATMLAQGDDKPIWLTEIGWSAAQHSCETGMWAGQKLAGVTEAEQAQYLKEAYHCLAADPYVQVAMWFNNRDLVGDGKMNNMYGLKRVDGSTRPAFDAFADVALHGDRLTGPCGDFGAPTVQILSPTASTVIGTGEALPVKVTTPDKDVLRIMLEVKGAMKIRSFTNGGQPLGSGSALGIKWQGVKRLPFGTHTLVATAIDAQGNKGTAEIKFRKVNPAKLSSQSTRFPQLRLLGSGRKRALSGQVKAKLPFSVPGKVLVEWQNRRGGKWKKIHGSAYNASKPFKFKQTLKYKGTWRVRVKYAGKRPFRSSVSRWVTFEVR
jgi:hypothetical protein